jgi:asparagine synthetase A
VNQEITVLDQISDRIPSTEKVTQTEIEESFSQLFKTHFPPRLKFVLSLELLDRYVEY